VQRLLTEKRELMVTVERLRLELAEIQARAGKPDPRLARLEDENRRLRAELAAVREERDGLREGVQEALDRLQAGK
jgi:predicted nuclease with TOPRIM domain